MTNSYYGLPLQLSQKLLKVSPYRKKFLSKDVECWWVPGFTDPGFLAIKCKVLEMSCDGRPFLDEPTVSPVHVEDVYQTREEAENVLWNLASKTNRYRWYTYMASDYESNLENFRHAIITYFKNNINSLFTSDFKVKVRKKDWFNLDDLQVGELQ